MNAQRRLIAVVGTLLSLALPPPVAAQVPPRLAPGMSNPKPAPADLPIITSFNVNPASLVYGDTLSINWVVIPGPGGSPITRIALTADSVPLPIVSGVNSYTFPYNWAGPKTFTLTAYNATGSSFKVSRVHGSSVQEAINNITIVNMEASPINFKVGQPIDFLVFINNRNPMPLLSANVFVTQGSRVVGNMTNTNLAPTGSGGPGISRTIRDTGFTGSDGTYTVDVEYKGLHKTMNFVTKPVTVYTIQPAYR